ncbi:hypothetical protein E4M02_07335 [Brevundimonas sp. S30B]|nr:hypothetical protein E4M01_08805 [Brevundimonas sp. MF30-B]TFW02786.1 hypothetical protein E4M02_07335 [Brevundimonas sp. S30B]
MRQRRLAKEVIRFTRGRHSYRVVRETIRTIRAPWRGSAATRGSAVDLQITYVVYRDGQCVGEGPKLNEVVSRIIRHGL